MNESSPFDFLTHYIEGMGKISANDLNAFAKVAKMVMNFHVAPPLGCHVTETGISLYIQDQFVEFFIAKIQSAGPAAEPDYIDGRYWFKRCYCSSASGNEHSAIAFAELAGAHPDYIHSTATNMSELDGRTHEMKDTDYVVVYSLFDNQSPPVKRYYFWDSGGFSNPVLAKVMIRTDGTTAHVAADAFKFVRMVDGAPLGSPIVADNPAAILTGTWTTTTFRPNYYGTNYFHDQNTSKGNKSALYIPGILRSGWHEVFMWWPVHVGWAANVPVDIIHNGGTTTVLVNESVGGGAWFSLGTYYFSPSINFVEFGKTVPDPFMGGAAVELDPCESSGDDNAVANVFVHFAPDRQFVKVRYAKDTILAFIRYPRVHVADGVHGILVGTIADTTKNFVEDYWFHITGNMAWATVDASRDYRLRFIDTAAVWNYGPPADIGSGEYEWDISMLESEQLVWVAEHSAQGLQRYIPKAVGLDYLIMRFLGAVAWTLGDFHLRIDGATGFLQAESTNYVAEYNVRVRLRAGRQVLAANDINVP